MIDDNFMNLKKQSAPKKAIDTERELARKLLQKCSEPIISMYFQKKNLHYRIKINFLYYFRK